MDMPFLCFNDDECDMVVLILPILISLFTMLVLRKSSTTAGIIGVLSAAVLALWHDDLMMNATIMTQSLINTTILSLTAFCVILPGLALGTLLDRYQYNSNIRHFLTSLPIKTHHKVLLLLFGLLPAVESITGFGISLILAIPILFSLFRADVAGRLSMLSMNTISWGTLGLSTLVGAKIAGIDSAVLGMTTAYFMPLMLLLFCLVALRLLGKGLQLQDIIFTILLISLFSISLYIANRFGLVELAGVIAGFVNFLMFGAYLLYRAKQNPMHSFMNFLAVMTPYLLVVAFVISIKALTHHYPTLLDISTLHGYGVNFVFFASPCLAILMTIAVIAVRHRHHRVQFPLVKALKACATLFIFILLAQLMNFAGFITQLMAMLDDMDNIWLFALMMPLFAMLSGFVTGSNLGGNALLMDISSKLGDNLGQGVLFSAIQNAGAGFAVFASMPMIILICTIASQNKHGGALDEKSLLAFGLKLLIGVYLMMVLTLVVLIRFV